MGVYCVGLELSRRLDVIVIVIIVVVVVLSIV